MQWNQSHLETMMTCPERFRREYVLKEGLEAYNAGTLIGWALHEAFAYAARYRKRYQASAEVDEVIEQARLQWQVEVKRDAERSDPIPWGKDSGDAEGDIKAREQDALAMARRWAENQDKFWAKYGEPSAIEHGFTGVSVEGSEHTIGGTIDLLTKRNVPLPPELDGGGDFYTEVFTPIDWKSGSSAWRGDKARKKLQRIFYSRAIEDLTGQYPSHFYFIQVVRSNTKEGMRYSLRTYEVAQRPMEEKALLARLLNDYSAQVQAGIYPLNTSSGLCSAEWCPFFASCPGSALGKANDNERGADGADSGDEVAA